MKYKVLFIVALAFSVFAGCEYESPLTNEHNIPVDSAVLGLWETVQDNSETAGSSEKMLVLKYSDTEYLVHYPIGDEAFYFRGYPIKIGNISCVQVQLIGDANGDIKKEERKYQVVSYELSNGELEIKTLNTDLVNKDLKESNKLRKAFMKNRGNVELFQNPVKFVRCMKK
ncbi:MAG: hypothetical protein ABIJ52_02755 [Pseudomonadota bacterium]|nr:hypothetical protein [Pseudomonadota bacterium]MBU1397329.1 hypothetical protein [Pseudomonadota bacterium]MBU1569968.1 hypothetical protein [Pseudomonadota bacterium]